MPVLAPEIELTQPLRFEPFESYTVWYRRPELGEEHFRKVAATAIVGANGEKPRIDLGGVEIESASGGGALIFGTDEILEVRPENVALRALSDTAIGVCRLGKNTPVDPYLTETEEPTQPKVFAATTS